MRLQRKNSFHARRWRQPLCQFQQKQKLTWQITKYSKVLNASSIARDCSRIQSGEKSHFVFQMKDQKWTDWPRLFWVKKLGKLQGHHNFRIPKTTFWFNHKDLNPNLWVWIFVPSSCIQGCGEMQKEIWKYALCSKWERQKQTDWPRFSSVKKLSKLGGQHNSRILKTNLLTQSQRFKP